MSINVEVSKSGQENSAGIIRRFTKRVQGAGILTRVRSKRYHTRKLSSYKVKKSTLVRLGRQVQAQALIKLGKPLDLMKK